ncbi:MAG: sensor domain-containing diguanylate cyclase [Oceanicoccus sp.]
MQSPDFPNNEEQRLRTLSTLNVLDTLPEERFDRITRLAKKMFNVPIALVSIIDHNRQWFKSRQGLDATETPRDISFCGHAILGEGTFYIPDASVDSRFSDNPLVTGPPDIRFYAGHPLRAPNGDIMGTLCIIDSVPKIMQEDDFLALVDLAAMVEQELGALQLATIDDLTALSNRRGFNRMAEHSMNLCYRQKLPITLAYFDLNKFKSINDEYGHAEGDRALTVFSSQMEKSFRDSDVLGRIGGDEFVVLFTNADKALASRIVSRFSDNLRMASAELKCIFSLEFSCGIVEFDRDKHNNIDALLAAADSEMYQHKRSEKNVA